MPKSVKNVIILGAAGRDFHDFNVLFRGDDAYKVVAFTDERFEPHETQTYTSADGISDFIRFINADPSRMWWRERSPCRA